MLDDRPLAFVPGADPGVLGRSPVAVGFSSVGWLPADASLQRSVR